MSKYNSENSNVVPQRSPAYKLLAMLKKQYKKHTLFHFNAILLLK